MNINILDLPFDILVLIFEQIETFEDKKNFARTHPTLWDVFANLNQKDVKSVVDLDEGKRNINNHWDFILEWWGPNVNKICNTFCHINSGDLIEIASKFCPNLEYISLAINRYTFKKIDKNLPILRKLQEIRMEVNFWNYSYTHWDSALSIVNLIFWFQSFTNLRHLNLESHILTADEKRELNKLIQLKELKIGKLTADDVDDLADLLGHLRVLMFQYNPDTETLNRLAVHCTNLEKLSCEDHINNRTSLEPFYANWTMAYFPRLIYLHIFDIGSQSHLLCQLDSRYNNQLKVLYIPSLNIGEQEIIRITDLRALDSLFCSRIEPSTLYTLANSNIQHLSYWDSKCLTMTDLMRLVRESAALRILRSACLGLGKEFLSEILDLLEAKGFQPEWPFQLYNTTYTDYRRNQALMIEYAAMPKSNLMKLQLM